MASAKELEDEMRRRGLLVSTETVLEGPKTTLQEFQNFGESLVKGPARGVIDLVGGWGNLYDYLTKSKDPSALSSAGIMRGIKNLTGVDINKIPGYQGVYEFGAAGAPAAALTAVGLPGLFGRTPAGLAGEFGVAGSTGMLSQAVAPDSPLAQLAIQSTPYAGKAAYQSVQRAVNAPVGQMRPFGWGSEQTPFPSPGDVDTLLRVGRMTPGELGQSRAQLATEARVEAAAGSGQAPIAFRQGQALDVEGFLTNLFERSAGGPVTPARAQATTQSVVGAFQNFGKALSSKLRSDARRDFGAAKGGEIDTTPVIEAAKAQLAKIAPEEPGFATLKQSLDRIIEQYEIPGTPATTTPSAILGPTGAPASVSITPEVPASVQKIDTKRLQSNLAVWGDAAYSGKADFGKGNIFEGVAPGKAKGIALSILQGFRQSLDDAIDKGVPGAEQLVQARNNFRDNILRIEEFANRPLTRAFDVGNVSELVPENVVKKLKELPASQQAVLIDVMQNSPDGSVQAVLDTVRRSRMDEVLAKAQVKGGAATDPTFSIQQALKGLQANGDLAALFPAAKDLQDARLALQFMQRVLTKEGAAGGAGGGGVAYAATRTAGGTSAAGLIASELLSLVRSTLASPAALSKLLFDGDNRALLMDLAKKKTTAEKAFENVKTLGQNVGILGVRGGPALSTGAPEMPEAAAAPASSEMTAQDLEAEMKRRGLIE
jgi:hypothetical protein